MVQYKASISTGLLQYDEHDEHDEHYPHQPFMNKSDL